MFVLFVCFVAANADRVVCMLLVFCECIELLFVWFVNLMFVGLPVFRYVLISSFLCVCYCRCVGLRVFLYVVFVCLCVVVFLVVLMLFSVSLYVSASLLCEFNCRLVCGSVVFSLHVGLLV